MSQPGKFDLEGATKGYALNRLCYTLNDAKCRAEFAADVDAYCTRFGLSDEERAAVKSRNKQALIAAGGNMYYFQKLNRVKFPEEQGAEKSNG